MRQGSEEGTGHLITTTTTGAGLSRPDCTRVQTLSVVDCLTVIKDALGDQEMRPTFSSTGQRTIAGSGFKNQWNAIDTLTMTEEQAARMSWTDERIIDLSKSGADDDYYACHRLLVNSAQTLSDTAAPDQEYKSSNTVSVTVSTLDNSSEGRWSRMFSSVNSNAKGTGVHFDIGTAIQYAFFSARWNRDCEGEVEVNGKPYASLKSYPKQLRARITIDFDGDAKHYEFESMDDLKAQAKKIAKFIATKSQAFAATGRNCDLRSSQAEINALLRKTLGEDEERAALASGTSQMQYAIKELGDGIMADTDWSDDVYLIGTMAHAGVWTLSTPIGFVRFDAHTSFGKLYANFSISKDTSGMNEATLCGGPDTSYTTKEFIALVKQTECFVSNLTDSLDTGLMSEDDED